MYEVFLTREAQCFYEKANDTLTRKLNRCFETPSKNPFDNANIKFLKGTLTGLFRYRVICQIDKNKVTVLLIVHISKAYK